MSGKRASQRSSTSSDFSIARILSTDLSPNDRSNLRNKFTVSGVVFSQFREKPVNDNAVEAIESETKNQDHSDDNLTKMERLQPGRSLNCQQQQQHLGNFANLKQDLDGRSKILGKELPWLRCTRYSPPKLPRRPSAGKQVKRRLGSQPRIPFTKLQIQVLEEKYRISAYLSRKDVIQLAENLNLPQNRVSFIY